MATTNTEDNFMGIRGGHTADDHEGHTGHGGTPEQAQNALEQAQRDNDSSAYYEPLLDINIGSGHPPDK